MLLPIAVHPAFDIWSRSKHSICTPEDYSSLLQTQHFSNVAKDMTGLPRQVSSHAEKVTHENRPETLFLLRRLWNREEVSIFSLIYAYFRWLDDYVDLSHRNQEDKILFVDQQWDLWKKLYCNNLTIESSSTIYSSILRWVVAYDREHNCVLQKHINRFFNAIMYDANRQYKLESEDALLRYSFDLGGAYTTILIILSTPNNKRENSHKLAEYAGFASHQIHILRDFFSDIKLGFFNISKQDIDSYGLSLNQNCSNEIRPWVYKVVERAQSAFDTGIAAINRIHSVKCRFLLLSSLSPYLGLMESIKKDNYYLKNNYKTSTFDKFRYLAWALLTTITPINYWSIFLNPQRLP